MAKNESRAVTVQIKCQHFAVTSYEVFVSTAPANDYNVWFNISFISHKEEKLHLSLEFTYYIVTQISSTTVMVIDVESFIILKWS